MTWVKLYDIERPQRDSIDFESAEKDIVNLAYYLSLLGLDMAWLDLLDLPSNWYSGNDNSEAILSRIIFEAFQVVNAQGGDYVNALQAASFSGLEKVM